MQQSSTFLGFMVLAAAILLILFGVFTMEPKETERAEDRGGDEEQVTALERPSIDFGNPYQGNVSAPVTVVGYSDYLCPACATMNETMRQLVVKDPEAVRYVWKDYPITSADSKLAAIAARCAERQGMFWEYHDLLFSMQGSADSEVLTFLAESLGLDMNEFNECLRLRDTAAIVERDMVEGQRLRVDSVPYTFIGDRRISGSLNYEQLEKLIESARAANATGTANGVQ